MENEYVRQNNLLWMNSKQASLYDLITGSKNLELVNNSIVKVPLRFLMLIQPIFCQTFDSTKESLRHYG